MARLMLVTFAAGLTAACGQRGDLFLPEAEREAVPAIAPPTIPAAGPAAAQAPTADDDDDQAGANGARPAGVAQ